MNQAQCIDHVGETKDWKCCMYACIDFNPNISTRNNNIITITKIIICGKYKYF